MEMFYDLIKNNENKDNCDKNELRERIVAISRFVPQGEKIIVDPVILESLIFEEKPARNELNVLLPAKQIVWSGSFLSKIDLSKISFNNVYWGDENSKDFSNTNINVNFLESCGSHLVNANFNNVDLSESFIQVMSEVRDCQLRNTNYIYVNLHINKDNDFRDNDLYHHFISFNLEDSYNFYNSSTRVENTGLHLMFGEEFLVTPEFIALLRSKRLNGCYVNDKLVIERQIMPEQKVAQPKLTLSKRITSSLNKIFASIQ